jgi:hypothetical protein
MATKKAQAKAPKPEPAGPSYEDLLQARRRMNEAHSTVAQAEREFRSARSINDASHRETAQAEAFDRLTLARQEAAEATINFETLKFAAGGGR